MKNKIFLILLVLFTINTATAQDTFSIVAVDPVTGEVGSAGASCVDLAQAGFSDASFLGQLVPSVGAINTQAFYIPENQDNALGRMNLGETPSEIIDWLVANDIQSQPQFRQYGIAALIDELPETAAFTGSSTDDFKGDIVGPTYSIQGNILLGQEVLDGMEARFLAEEGDLACKLMAALQGANIVGADVRCTSNGTSSLFAFVKVAQPTDTFGNPSLNVSVITGSNDGIEPIDALQTEFDLVQECTNLDLTETENFSKSFSLYPNPSSEYLTIENKTAETYTLYLYDILGKLVYQESMLDSKTIDVTSYQHGTYFLKIANDKSAFVKKLIIE